MEKRRRNRNFADTHQILIEKTAELIAQWGADAVSVSRLARATQITRSTIYYHFDSRETLIGAVHIWSSEQLAKEIRFDASSRAGAEHISSFVLRNPELIKLWIDDYFTTGDMRQRYPQWDRLLAQVAASFDQIPTDAEQNAAI